MPTAPPTVILVPGAFLGPWIWEPVAARLRAAGLAAVAVELASVPMSEGAAAGDLYADAARVRSVLDRVDGPALVCGHSYGGAVITQAAAGPHPAVRRLVYLAGAVPDAGEGLADLAPRRRPGDQEPVERVQPRADGTIHLRSEAARAALFHDCDRDAAEAAATRLRPMNPEASRQPVTAAPWRDLPTTDIRCTRDQLPRLVSAGFLERVGDVVELPTGHCPQWSRPDLVAEVLVRGLTP